MMIKPRAKALMVQGTGSGVGKSVLTAAFCRIFRDKGLRVAPFKAQNMALNSFVTEDGLEMGRAQVYQAEACGLAPDVRMNPVLLKPSADNCSQVILMGKPAGNRNAKDYYSRYKKHLDIVRKAYTDLAGDFDVIVIEGAGSPAEINLQATDLVNMQMAAFADAAVLIVGDIDKGGVFAWMKGTYDLIQEEHKKRVKGFLINKFRGDISLLEPGNRSFEAMTGVPILGVIPYFRDIRVDEEDAIPPDLTDITTDSEHINIGVVQIPHISNFTDFIPLAHEKDVHLHFARRPIELEACDVIILPGSKSTISDAAHLARYGFFETIKRLRKQGTFVVGICGGYQMLGDVIYDPDRIEGNIQKIKGVGLLPVETTIKKKKILRQGSYRIGNNTLFEAGYVVRGYEIHMGKTVVKGKATPVLDGADPGICLISKDKTVLGTYIHGFFDDDGIRRSFINYFKEKKGFPVDSEGLSYHSFRETQFERLARVVRDNCAMELIYQMVGI
jgi:adenosylcobyric acid synthase